MKNTQDINAEAVHSSALVADESTRQTENGAGGRCGARRVACLTCPFNDGYNEQASVAQNYGCLPTKFDILVAKDEHGEDWMCHDDETLICGGLAAERKVGDGKQVKYSAWYQGEAGWENERRAKERSSATEIAQLRAEKSENLARDAGGALAAAPCSACGELSEQEIPLEEINDYGEICWHDDGPTDSIEFFQTMLQTCRKVFSPRAVHVSVVFSPKKPWDEPSCSE